MQTLKQGVVLITGGAGFIGCALSSELRNLELPILAVDCLHPQVHPNADRPAMLPAEVELIKEDVQKPETWVGLFERVRPEVIIHLAAETGTGQSLTEASRHSGVNVMGTARMIDAMSAYGIRPRHIVLCSSRAVYGEGAWQKPDGEIVYPSSRTHEMLLRGCWTPPGEDHEVLSPLPHNAAKHPPHPVSIYGATKLTQEHILSAWCTASEVPLSILRLQNVFGPGQSAFNSYTGIITLFHRLAGKGQEIEVYEDGQIGRDFVYISDVINALLACLDQLPEKRIRLLDVGTGRPTTILEAARFIARLHNSPEPRISGKFRDGDVRWACCDPKPLQCELGVTASVDFAEGCTAVGKWLKQESYA